MTTRFTVRQFNYHFPTEDSCLEELKIRRFGERLNCPKCSKNNKFYKVKGRKAYQCNSCRYQIYPLKGTIFEKSTTPLKDWYYAMYLMAQTRSGISAMQLQRMLGVTYKTAWRMFHQIRKLMADDGSLLTGEIEIDEAYFTPDPWMRRKSKPKGKAQVIVGLVERGGRVKAKHIPKAGIHVIPVVEESVDKKAQLYTDGYMAYRALYQKLYNHQSVNHMKGEYVRGKVHTNTIEGFWSTLRRGLRGVYRHVDPRYLQAYIDEYAWRYSHRNDAEPMFWTLVQRASQPCPKAS